MIRDRTAALLTRFKREISVYRLVLRDSRTPWPARVLLGAAIAYILLPFDLIPDFIPVLGHVDDLLIVPMLIWLAIRMIPTHVVQDARASLSDNDDNGVLGS